MFTKDRPKPVRHIVRVLNDILTRQLHLIRQSSVLPCGENSPIGVQIIPRNTGQKLQTGPRGVLEYCRRGVVLVVGATPDFMDGFFQQS